MHFAFSVTPGGLDELHARLREPEGNVVEAWDFFNRGEGAREGTAAFR